MSEEAFGTQLTWTYKMLFVGIHRYSQMVNSSGNSGPILTFNGFAELCDGQSLNKLGEIDLNNLNQHMNWICFEAMVPIWQFNMKIAKSTHREMKKQDKCWSLPGSHKQKCGKICMVLKPIWEKLIAEFFIMSHWKALKPNKSSPKN